MLINLFPIAFFNEYIISPKIWLHYIKYNRKIVSFFFYLSYFYYIHSIHIISINLIFIKIIIYPYFSFKKIFNNLHHILPYCLIIYSTTICHNTIITNILIKVYTKIWISLYKTINFIYTFFYSYLVDKLFIKILLIPVTCFLCLKTLFLTTRYEHTISYIIIILQHFKILVNIHMGFLMTISSQIFLLITQKISYLITSIRLRNMNINCIKKYIQSYYALLKDLLNFIDSRIITISLIIYIRRIESSNFIFIDT
uniref:Uncharacterized protein n=2 Tax=Kappaphycus TaxID=38543 RepID=A0A8E7PI85_9FLOR|nr:hypothetical protein [Kappaphycus striatus]